MRTPRPLPDPRHSHALRAINADPLDDAEESMIIVADGPGMDYGYQTEGLGWGRSPRQAPASPRILRAKTSGSGKSFVGGFVQGLRRFPRVFGYKGEGEKPKFFRRGNFSTGDTSVTAMTTGNTLPLYTSNPSTPVAGPSNPRYVQGMNMPVPFAEDPPPVIVGPSLSQRRQNPSYRVIPPSEEALSLENTTSPDPFPPEAPQFAEDFIESSRNANTVTIFDLPEQEYLDDPSMPHRTPTSNRLTLSNHTPARPAIPSPVPTPNRRSEIPPQQPEIVPPLEEAFRSPTPAHPPPTTDYLKMTLSSVGHGVSPRTRATSLTSEPSFSSELNPVKRFFVELYRLPWIAHDRVTTDYRPRGLPKNERVPKKPMASWYTGKPGAVLAPKAGSGEVDLLSSGSRSGRGSTGTSYVTPASTRTRHRSSEPQRRRHREHNKHGSRDTTSPRREHRSNRRRYTTSTVEVYQPQAASPIIPAVYPYPYPYGYPYSTFPSVPPIQQTHSHSTPRGPRPHRGPTYPHGYAPYQPAQAAQPVYMVHSPAHSNGSGDAAMVSPVFMPFVPGAYAFAQEPTTADSPPAADSGPSAGV
ncbi:hypothetical protein H0H81_010458 [Sphagnurus paluster]|uniref:Uncharacterized protein n=1 Tax=Sphagnurus paluster TaxID=117069 RepID=A0A9P7KKM2_9AGAR|nr:hypothetical protein H0H81_010458 [Sphagnurus paluster]